MNNLTQPQLDALRNHFNYLVQKNNNGGFEPFDPTRTYPNISVSVNDDPVYGLVTTFNAIHPDILSLLQIEATANRAVKRLQAEFTRRADILKLMQSAIIAATTYRLWRFKKSKIYGKPGMHWCSVFVDTSTDSRGHESVQLGHDDIDRLIKKAHELLDTVKTSDQVVGIQTPDDRWLVVLGPKYRAAHKGNIPHVKDGQMVID